MISIHEAGALLAAELSGQWERRLGRKHGLDRTHFEIRVWNMSLLVVRALTATARSWHRIQNIDGKLFRGYPVTVVFIGADEDFVAGMRAVEARYSEATP